MQVQENGYKRIESCQINFNFINIIIIIIIFFITPVLKYDRKTDKQTLIHCEWLQRAFSYISLGDHFVSIPYCFYVFHRN